MLSFYLTLIDTQEEQTRFIELYEKYRKLMHYVAKDIVQDDRLAESLHRENTYFDFPPGGPEDENDTVNYHLLLQEILRLPEKYREVLYLVGAYECSMAETANLLNLPKETVKKRMQRGRKLLLERLEESNRE